MNAPMRIYVPVMDGEPLSSWHYSTSPYAPEKDVEFIRADIHDAQIDALKAENALMKELLEVWYNDTYIPDSNCACHINPPCNDCVNYGGLREAAETTKRLLEAE